MSNPSVEPDPSRLLPDTDDEDARRAVIEEALCLNREHGYAPNQRCLDLCEAYIRGAMDLEQLRLEVIRPYLH